MGKHYKISEATRRRCHIFEVAPEDQHRFTIISLELFHYLFEVKHIDFSIYFRVGNTMIEYITQREFSHELVNNIIKSRNKEYDDLDICLETKDMPHFNGIINNVRNKKIHNLLQKDPHLDPDTLKLFSNLSAASQMVVKGGIDQKVATFAKETASQVIDNLMESEIAIGTLSRMVLADPTLYDHSASVAMIAGVIAQKLLKKPKEISEKVALGGLYHDVGKTCVPCYILNKPGSFTPEEFEIMKTHTTLGYEELLKAIDQGAPIEQDVARVAHEHHEKFKGGGYPCDKHGRLEEHDHGIHEYARIVTIADVYSALLMKRVYKEAFSQEKALSIMQKASEQSYDPIIWGMFENNVQRSLKFYDLLEKRIEDKSKIIDMDEKKKKDKAQKSRKSS
ncbi:HD-GYP domain-containing protein [Pseudobacteriovorax antillogorgiicola]|uniref:HDIG domain-containing protein n=1 Tax=Pseudobacteriovorax antillogorgiicola TaxID=1513793 RepID=A0A1Y6B7Z8_9BACT|nr:HD domain-containing phosphohydrolase [Pseudobacteriovorax antillogorgiicola]TCS58546.1 putative nucleotidyltransferase with HDIG domain [Pseudobacteriovorax antillogorgiicola]SME97761.1 HDIG domain-containing protein [Pseudobacteriovorax antillogorgiicola]